MTERPQAIRDVVVVGGGLVGWSAAAALRRRLPALSVTVVPVPPTPDALADRLSSTLPSIVGFHHDIGLTEVDSIFQAGSVVRLGTRFEAWNEGAAPYDHAYAPHGHSMAGAPFHLLWIRARRTGRAEPFDAYSAGAAFARSARVVPVGADLGATVSDVEPGLRIDPLRYLDMIRAYALHLGAKQRAGAPVDVKLRADDGFIKSLVLDDGSEIAGHLFIDCTGPGALIRSRLDDNYEDWGQWLPCDRILLAEPPTTVEPSPLDKAIAMPGGWRWEAAGARRTSHGYVYASAHLGDEEARQTLREAAGAEPQSPPLRIRQGRRPAPWLRNCVAIGDAAVSLEPLESTNLHLAHSAIDRIVAMMPDRDCSPVELWDYNRQCAAEAERIRDFLILHYVTSSRADPFWRAASGVQPPPSLEHTLSLFRERGRLPFYEEETFSRDSWLAVLLGQQVMPRRTDPLIDAIPPALAEQSMAAFRKTIEATLPKLPSQSEYLNHLMRQAAR